MAIEIEPKQSVSYLDLAEVYSVQNNFDAAKEILLAGLEQNPDNVDLLERLKTWKSEISLISGGDTRKIYDYDGMEIT